MTQWKDVLELGLHLIRELKLDQRDTIDRWMACHLAELIDASENGKTEAEREEARKVAVETILKIWEHRSSLPGNAYPLAQYKDILIILGRLRPDGDPFINSSHQTDIKSEKILFSLYDELSRLFITILLMRIPSESELKQADLAAVKALNEEEHEIYNRLHELIKLFTSDSGTSDLISEEDGKLSDVGLRKFAIELLDTITERLGDLRQELKQDTTP